MNNWISVEDRLPPQNITVIIDGGIGRLLCDAWYSYTGCEGRLIEWKVTHWQPLPKLPAEEKP